MRSTPSRGWFASGRFWGHSDCSFSVCTFRLPKPISASSLSLRRLQVDPSDEEDKEGILDESQASINISKFSNASGMVKVRKITKL